MIKNLAHHAQRNNAGILLILIMISLHTKNLVAHSHSSACQDLLNSKPTNRIIFNNINKALISIQSDIQSGNENNLLGNFHPRLKMNAANLSRILSKIKQTLGKPIKTLLSQAWLLYSNEKKTSNWIKCSNNSSYKPLYGYAAQAVVVLKINGMNELGQIVMHLVPSQTGTAKIGSFYFYKSTHLGLDAIKWVEKYKNLDDEVSIVKIAYLRIAQKLAFGGGYYKQALYQSIRETQSLKNHPYKGLKLLKASKGFRKLVFLSATFENQGIGLLLRFKNPQVFNVKDSQKFCKEKSDDLMQHDWFRSYFNGLRCSIIFADEKPTQEGKLGSLWLKNTHL